MNEINTQLIDFAQTEDEEIKLLRKKMISIIGITDTSIRDQLYYLRSQTTQLKRFQWCLSWEQFKEFVMTNLLEIANPNSLFQIIWSLMSMVFIFFQMIQIPLVLSYFVEIEGGWKTLNDLIDIFFVLDMVQNFNLAYYEKGDLVFDRKKIALNYLSAWFWVDVVAIFPYDQLMDDSSNADLLKFIRLLKFIKILRLLRVLKLGKLLGKMEETFMIDITVMALIQFIKITISILCIAHWIACIWNIIEFYDGEVEKTWHKEYGIGDAPWEVKYISAFYFSITTMITVGYGDIHPYTSYEILFGIFSMVLASAIFGYSMSSLMFIIEGDDPSVLEIKEQNAKIIQYIKQKKVPQSLQSRVKNYLEWLAGSKQIAKNYEMLILNTLSMNLKTEVICLLNGRILHSVKLIGHTFSDQLINKLVYDMKEQMLGPEEYVFKENSDDNDKLYFIQNGSLQLTLSKKDISIKTLKKGDYFGEIGFFGRLKRTANAKSTDFVNLVYLFRVDVWENAKNLDHDLQRLFFFQHSLEIGTNLKPLKIRCYICDRPHHLARNCSKVHFRPQKMILLQEYYESVNYRDTCFRKRQSKSTLWKKLKEIEEKQQKFKAIEFREFQLFAYAQLIPDDTTSFDIDLQKDYSNFFQEFNLCRILEVYNKYVEQRIVQNKEEKAQQFKRYWESQKKIKHGLIVPRQSRNSFPQEILLTQPKSQEDRESIKELDSESSSYNVNCTNSPSLKLKNRLSVVYQRHAIQKHSLISKQTFNFDSDSRVKLLQQKLLHCQVKKFTRSQSQQTKDKKILELYFLKRSNLVMDKLLTTLKFNNQ